MKMGPIQFVAIGYDDPDFRRQILEELDAVRGRGVIRLIDLLFIYRDEDGDLTMITDTGMDSVNLVTYGLSLIQLAGLGRNTMANKGGVSVADTAKGINPEDVQYLISQMPRGSGQALVLFEHTWAGDLAESIREAGGYWLAQGMVTRDAVLMMGAEMAAIAEAERAIEAANAIKGNAVLDTLSAAETAQEMANLLTDEAITSTITAETLRTLMAIGVIDDSEIETSILALVEAGLLSHDAVTEAISKADAAIAAVESAYNQKQ